LPFKHDPGDCLADIIDNSERIDGYITGMDRSSFEWNGLVRDGVERCLERVCEAIHRRGPRAEALMPGQPWGEIRGTGNRLRHAYDRISLEVIWGTVRHDLPGLVTAARQALANLESNAP
jgi:uncharacterized protein with HEPN domain